MAVNRRIGRVLKINPASDLEFEGVARGLAIDLSTTPETLQAALRRTFPRVVVHRRELSGENLQTWYVYRDGHWISIKSADRAAPAPEDDSPLEA